MMLNGQQRPNRITQTSVSINSINAGPEGRGFKDQCLRLSLGLLKLSDHHWKPLPFSLLALPSLPKFHLFVFLVFIWIQHLFLNMGSVTFKVKCNIIRSLSRLSFRSCHHSLMFATDSYYTVHVPSVCASVLEQLLLKPAVFSFETIFD